jgi:hypothetical protein
LLVTFGVALGACSEKPPQPPVQGPSPYRLQVLADKPAGYWRLDEESGAVAFDQTTNANQGAIRSGVTQKYAGATAGDGDTAMFFDGVSGQVAVPSSPSLQMPFGTVTLEAWVKPAGLQRGAIFLLGKGTAGVQTEYGFMLMDGVPAYQSVVERYVASAPPLQPGSWTHLAVTIANNEAGTFYVNGKEAGTFSAKTGHIVTSSTQPVMIGNEAAASMRFVGAIDEPAIYPSVLTAEQLALHVTLAAKASR